MDVQITDGTDAIVDVEDVEQVSLHEDPWRRYADDVTEYLLGLYGLPERWNFAANNRSTMAECILDAVFSPRARHTVVDRMIERFTAWTLEERQCVTTSSELFLAICGDRNRPWIPDGEVLPRTRTAGEPKRDIAKEVARVLGISDIEDCAAFREMFPEQHEELRRQCLMIRGFGESTWVHLCMLAGSVIVTPTTSMRRFMAVDDYRVPDEDIIKVLRLAADTLAVPYAAVVRAVDLASHRRSGILLDDLDRIRHPEPPAA